jgi:hypothetical protein
MSFFIPGKTTCGICKQTIQARIDAAQLPYAHPDDVSLDVAKLSRSYVHRDCWDNWELAVPYASSAFNLISKHSDPSSPQLEFSQDGVIVLSILNGKSYRLQDLDTLATIELSIEENPETINFFIQALTKEGFKGQFITHPYNWNVEYLEKSLKLTSSQSGELIEEFLVSPIKQKTWLIALRQISNELHKKSLQTSVNM